MTARRFVFPLFFVLSILTDLIRRVYPKEGVASKENTALFSRKKDEYTPNSTSSKTY
jgi:hypothetical protein